MKLFQLDPTQDARWSEFLELNPRASIFHSVGWLNALQSTYGYKPVAFTTSPPNQELKNGLVCCEVNSWVTGRRLVSLPFSDHCEPLFASAADLLFLIQSLQAQLKNRNWKYLEVRPVFWNLGQLDESRGFIPGRKYFLHILSLLGDVEEVFGNLDKDSVQRRVRHADRAGLTESCGTSEKLLKAFYALFVTTRGRHQVPPMPYLWFQNLIKSQGEALEIRVAYRDETPIAGILTLRFRDVLYYKYGCSDLRFNNLGAMPWLLWRAISNAKGCGANAFDMGRTETDNAGLLTFKNHWVPQPNHLIYWRYPHASSFDSIDSWELKFAKKLFSRMPFSLLTFAGRLIYRHIG
jgi:Acetyltransferase (GNAT) domain